MKTKKSTFKPQLLFYDWKDDAGDVFKELKHLLEKLGVFMLNEPFSIGSDTYGYILTTNSKMTIGDYKKLHAKEFGETKSDVDETFEDDMKDFNLKDSNPLTKLIKAYS